MWEKMPRRNNKSTPKHVWLASLEKKKDIHATLHYSSE